MTQKDIADTLDKKFLETQIKVLLFFPPAAHCAHASDNAEE